MGRPITDRRTGSVGGLCDSLDEQRAPCGEGALRPLSPQSRPLVQSGEVRVAARGGVRIDDPQQIFCIRAAMEAFAYEQPSLVLFVQSGHVPPAVEALACGQRATANGSTRSCSTPWLIDGGRWAAGYPPTIAHRLSAVAGRSADAREDPAKDGGFFCGGDAFLADGRLLSAGGTLDYGPFKGRKDAAVFDPQTEQWSFVASMAHGRWYPTLLTLGDGVILAATGLSEVGDAHNEALELYSSTDDAWETVHFAPGFPGLPLYAHLFLLEDGRVFFSGGRMDDPLNVQPCIMDISQGLVPTHPVADLLDPDTRNQSASVLLPPAQEQRVMVCGGGPVGKADKTDATDAVSIVDLRANDPRYVAAAPLGLPRLHLNAVILPDHTVFVTGGSLKQEDEPLARLQAEIYDPDNDTWRLMAAATVPRLYHSTALLLPDGRVVAAGGNPEGGTHVEWDADDMEEMRLEVFSPPYLFHGARPHIDAAPEQCNYGETITVTTAQAANVRWASLIKNGVTTHSFDSSQRLIDLDIEARDEGSLRATVTANPNIAPTGWYMLFIVDQRRIPSTATWIHLGP